MVCEVCGDDGQEEGNSIVLCDGSHSALVGYHQLCCNPPLVVVPDGEWMCPKCCDLQLTRSAARDPNYIPSSHGTSSSGSGSTSQSESQSDSDSSSDYISDSSNSSDSDSQDGESPSK